MTYRNESLSSDLRSGAAGCVTLTVTVRQLWTHASAAPLGHEHAKLPAQALHLGVVQDGLAVRWLHAQPNPPVGGERPSYFIGT